MFLLFRKRERNTRVNSIKGEEKSMGFSPHIDLIILTKLFYKRKRKMHENPSVKNVRVAQRRSPSELLSDYYSCSLDSLYLLNRWLKSSKTKFNEFFFFLSFFVFRLTDRTFFIRGFQRSILRPVKLI